MAVGVTSAPEADGAGADPGAGTGAGTGADAVAGGLRSSPQASLTSPPVPDHDELNRRGWDLLKLAEGWMLNPPKRKPDATSEPISEPISEAALPGVDPEAHGMRVRLEVRTMAPP